MTLQEQLRDAAGATGWKPEVTLYAAAADRIDALEAALDKIDQCDADADGTNDSAMLMTAGNIAREALGGSS